MSHPTEIFEEIPDDDKRGKRRYVGTLNNYDQTVIDAYQFFVKKHCTYAVSGAEIAPKTGTPHLQIYMEFKNAITMINIQKKMGVKFWMAYSRGSPKAAAGYCKKGPGPFPDDIKYEKFFSRTMEEPEDWQQPFEYGIISQQGKRTDICHITEKLVDGQITIAQVAQQHPSEFVKYHKGFQALRSHLFEPRSLSSPPDVIVLHGPTGTGKSRDALTKYWPELKHYVWSPNNNGSNQSWWDGYDGEDYIILDEFRGNMPWTMLLSLLDRNECRLPVKGGFVQCQASKFVITSPLPPQMWYKKDDRYDRFDQLTRRITNVIQYPIKQIQQFLKIVPAYPGEMGIY